MSVFESKVIVVTGASEGIGRALCKALAPGRPKLVLAARNLERLESLAMECEAMGAQSLAVATDVTDMGSCKALVEAAVARYGAIDVLVNNAGGTMWTRFDEIQDPSIFERLMRLNYLGSVYPTYFALPHLKRAKGRIVAVSSMTGIVGVPTRTAYSAAKHAVIGFFDALRVELMDSGVSVTIACPDFVASQIHKRALGPDGKPLGESPMAGADIMTAEACAALMVRAIERRERMMFTSARGRFGRWLKLLAPGAIDRMAARAIRETR